MENHYTLTIDKVWCYVHL